MRVKTPPRGPSPIKIIPPQIAEDSQGQSTIQAETGLNIAQTTTKRPQPVSSGRSQQMAGHVFHGCDMSQYVNSSSESVKR